MYHRNPLPMTEDRARMVKENLKWSEVRRRQKETEKEEELDCWFDNLEQEIEKEMCSKNA